MDSSHHYLRRSFLKTAAAAVLTGPATFRSVASIREPLPGEQQDQLIFLFQGDSITDGNRGRSNDPNHIMGHGYAFSIASRLGASFPGKHLQFYNRGISGNRLTDLAARWQKDALDIKPGVLSVLVGVNDIDYAVKQREPIMIENYYQVYSSLLQQVKSQLPNCVLVLCEPFIMPIGRVKESWETWNAEVQKIQKLVYKLASDYNAVYVPLQKLFYKASENTSPDYWIWDGIHPTAAGHEIITREWLKQVGRRLHFVKRVI